jgi:hypothetical protein
MSCVKIECGGSERRGGEDFPKAQCSDMILNTIFAEFVLHTNARASQRQPTNAHSSNNLNSQTTKKHPLLLSTTAHSKHTYTGNICSLYRAGAGAAGSAGAVGLLSEVVAAEGSPLSPYTYSS